MKGLFVDTAGWMACADAADPAHKQTCEARDSALEQEIILITTDYVMDETLTLIRKRLGLSAAEVWWEQIEGSSRLRWEWIGMARAEKARNVFCVRCSSTQPSHSSSEKTVRANPHYSKPSL